MIERRLPKIGEIIKRTEKGKRGSLSSYEEIDDKIVEKLQDNQVYLKGWNSSVHFTHFTKDGNVGIIGKAQKPTHIITWDTQNKEPFVVIYSNKEKQDKIKELVADDDVITNSIRVYDIGSIEEVSYKISLKKV